MGFQNCTNTRVAIGNIYKRVFNKQVPGPLLTKIPLFKFKEGTRLSAGHHFIEGAEMSEMQGAVLHFNHDKSTLEKAIRAHKKIDPRVKDTRDRYTHYIETILGDHYLSLFHKMSCEFEGSHQLVEMDLMRGFDRFITRKDVIELAKDRPYWKDRWRYIKEVVRILDGKEFNSVLELGPGEKTIVKNSDVMQIDDKYIGHCGQSQSTYKHDATVTPWPIKDKQYDLFIALQVWEHLGDKQKEAFKEVMRTSKMAVLSFPLEWKEPEAHNVTREMIEEWTLGFPPSEMILVEKPMYNRLVYLFEFGD
jgi:hypothetical protein